jgi:hypothetical protein
MVTEALLLDDDDEMVPEAGIKLRRDRKQKIQNDKKS